MQMAGVEVFGQWKERFEVGRSAENLKVLACALHEDIDAQREQNKQPLLPTIQKTSLSRLHN